MPFGYGDALRTLRDVREATAEERGPLLGEAQLRELAECVNEGSPAAVK